MGYKEEFKEYEYSVMLLKEQQGKTYREIGKIMGRSIGWVGHLYRRAKFRQRKIYLNRIMEATQASEAEFTEEMQELRREFDNEKFFIAYLEEKYATILTEYRDGEPASIYKTTDKQYSRNVSYKRRKKIIEPISTVTLDNHLSTGISVTIVLSPLEFEKLQKAAGENTVEQYIKDRLI